MKNLTIPGRILFGLSLLAFSINPLLHANETAAALPFQMAGLAISYISGLILLSGGVSLILNKWVSTTMLLVAGLLIVRAFALHLPDPTEGDSNIKMQQIMVLARDFGMAGAAMLIAGYSQKTNA